MLGMLLWPRPSALPLGHAENAFNQPVPLAPPQDFSNLLGLLFDS